MTEFTDTQIATALLYCRHDDGELCNICPYGCITGGRCSKQLYADASRRIKELIEERDELKERLDELERDI